MVDFLIFILVLVLASLLVYVMAYTVYFTACVFNSTKAKRFLLKQKYNAAAQPNNMIIIIYARNNESTIVPLLEALNKQNYNRENYQTHIILDHCTDNSSNILEFIGGAKIWRVGENAPVGKDEAVSWILEGLLSYQNVDAFVFLSADRYIDENFLPSINANHSRWFNRLYCAQKDSFKCNKNNLPLLYRQNTQLRAFLNGFCKHC